MEKNNHVTSFIVVFGIIILAIFVIILSLNLLPNHSSDSYYVKTNDQMEAKIESLEVENGNLIIMASGNVIEYCVKTTKTSPSLNNICWKKMESNRAMSSVYKYKKYYVWIKDSNNNISDSISINVN